MAEQNDIEEAVRILEDGSSDQQEEALEKLREISKTQPGEIVSHLDAICSFASDEETEVQRPVAGILAHIASDKPSTVIPYAGVVNRLLLHDDPIVLGFATAAAMRITAESPTALSDATDRLIELMTYEENQSQDPASGIRSRAILALGDLGEANSTLAARLDEMLAERLDDVSPLVRSGTVTSLRQLGLTHPDAVSTALTRLPSRLDDPDPETRHDAILAIVHFRHEQLDAISQPDTVVSALKQAAEQMDLNSKERKTVAETCEYIEETSVRSS
jgi:hypothetical protein